MKLKNLSIILVIVMILTVLPMSVHADIEDPYSQIKAANFDDSNSSNNKNKGYGLAISESTSSWVCYKNVNFGDTIPYAAVIGNAISDSEGWMNGNKVYLRLDSPSNDPFCIVDITECAGWSTPVENVGTITQKISGVHDIYISSNKPNDIYYFYFNGKSEGEVTYKPYEKTTVFSDLDKCKYGYEVEAMYGLGIIDEYKEGLFYPNLPILRGEFASWLARFMTETIPVAQENPFTDIENCTYKNEICYLYDNGILTLNDTKTFNPYDFMTVREASAMILRLMNYGNMIEYKGGWPYGYDSIARDIGLTSGMASGDYLRRAPAAKMLYNAIDAEYLEASSIKNDNITYEKTTGILEVRRNIYKGEGVVSATSFGGLTGEITVPDSSCYIGNTQFKLGENVSVDHYLGVKCEYYYYSSDNGDTKTLLYVSPVTKNETLVLDSADVDFSSITSELIKYTDKNDKEKKIKLNTNVNWIYNHRALGTTIEKVIKEPKKFTGSIRLVDNGNGYETVFVENYKNVKVGAYNEVTNVLVDSISGESRNFNNKTLIISDGTQNIRPNKLTRDMLLEVYESYDKDVVILLVGESEITGKATEKTSDGKVIINNTEYKFANEFDGKFELGVTMTFHLNRHGDIVYTESADATKSVGLLYDLRKEKDEYFITLITATDVKTEYKVASKIFIDGYGYKEYSDMQSAISGTTQNCPVLYRINEYDEIVMLDTPLTGTKTSDDVLTKLEEGQYFYRSGLSALVQTGGKRLVPVKSDAVWIAPRSSYGNGIDFSFKKVGNTISQYRDYELYSFDPSSKIVELMYSPSAIITNQDVIAVFKEYCQSIDAYNNLGIKASFIAPGGQEKTYFVSNENTSIYNQVKRLKKGDVLRLYTDTYGDIIKFDIHVFADGNASNGTDSAKMSGSGGLVESGFDYTYAYGTVKDITDGYVVVTTGATEQYFKLGMNDVVLISKDGELKKTALYSTVKVGDKVYIDVQGGSIKMTVVFEQ